MKKLNQTGFTAVEALLILILVAIVSFTGYYVYNAQHTADKTLDAVNKSAATQTNSGKLKTTSKATSSPSVDAISTDGKTVSVVTFAEIADTNDQAGVLGGMVKYCSSTGSVNTNVVVHYAVFKDGTSYGKDGGYAKINAGCGPATSNIEDVGGVFALHYLHRQSDGTWVHDAGTQQSPGCAQLDGKGYPVSIASICSDANGNERAIK